MGKICTYCGGQTHLALRTLVFHRHQIMNVPIHTCSFCERSEVSERVMPELQKLVLSLSFSVHQNQIVAFEEYSEFSNLLVMVANETAEELIEGMIEDRINQLLDLLLLASSLEDRAWVDEITQRLRQVI